MKKLGQISMKALGYSAKEIRKRVEAAGEAVFLGRIGGIAAEHFTGESKNGEFIGFRGRFLAVNAENEQFESKVAFFPAAIANRLRDQMEQGVVEIEIKADVFAVESEKNASGYAYLCEPIMSAETEEKIDRMAKSLFQNVPLAIENKSDTKKGDKKAA